MRPPTTKLMLRTSCSDAKEPDTRNDRVSDSVWIVPAGCTTFCAWSAAIKAERSRPRLARSCIENSTKIFSSWAPRISIFETSGTCKSFERTSST